MDSYTSGASSVQVLYFSIYAKGNFFKRALFPNDSWLLSTFLYNCTPFFLKLVRCSKKSSLVLNFFWVIPNELHLWLFIFLVYWSTNLGGIIFNSLTNCKIVSIIELMSRITLLFRSFFQTCLCTFPDTSLPDDIPKMASRINILRVI